MLNATVGINGLALRLYEWPVFTQRNVYEILLNHTEIRLYLPFSSIDLEPIELLFGSKSIGKWLIQSDLGLF